MTDAPAPDAVERVARLVANNPTADAVEILARPAIEIAPTPDHRALIGDLLARRRAGEATTAAALLATVEPGDIGTQEGGFSRSNPGESADESGSTGPGPRADHDGGNPDDDTAGTAAAAGEPASSSMDTGVRHISGEREDRESVKKDGTDDGASGVTDLDKNVKMGSWGAADFAAPEDGVWPPARLAREQWMGHIDKRPFAPWADRNHPDADSDEDARWKWGITDNYVDSETIALAEADHRLDGRAFIQQDGDPFAYVDGDKVRDPETGEVHPAFIDILDRLNLTYADISQSGTGVHAQYRGKLPDGAKQATWQLADAPWGANDEPPSIEIYAGKRVCVDTGAHVPGTPIDVRPWDDDALEAILDEAGHLSDEPPAGVDHDTNRDTAALEDYAPGATGREETTGDVRDVLAAVNRLDPVDLPLRTRQVGTDSTGWEQWDPSTYRVSEGQDSLHRPPDDPVFYDHKHGRTFGVLGLFAAEQGIITHPWDRLADEDWWAAVNAAREGGAPIPEYVPEPDPVPVLPQMREWCWRAAGRQQAADDEGEDDDEITVDAARDRTQDLLERVLRRSSGRAGGHPDAYLVEALPTLGKSHGAILATDATGEPITVLTGRGHKEQYEQFCEWCEAASLDYKTLPAFTRDCDTANGEHGDEWAETVRDWYRRGATPQDIHKHAEGELSRPLPCQAGEHDCPYGAMWRFDPDDYDVLIGHYTHAHKKKITKGRTVVVDEFPGAAYETALNEGALAGAVTHFLRGTDGLPFEDFTDLIEHRGDEQRRADALAWFADNEPGRDSLQAITDGAGHAAAPLATFTLLAGSGDNLGNGWERADLDPIGARGVGVHDRATGEIHLLAPPPLDYASGVVALDGTPTPEMWELALGVDLRHRQVLDPDERRDYLRNALGLRFVRTTDRLKPYNSADHVHVDADAALLEAIGEQHDQPPALITTRTAEREYGPGDVLAELVGEHAHYGDVLGSNKFKTERVGAVIGSQHFGDGFVAKWGAYAGEAVARNDGKGADLSYGPFGDKILTHMREHETLQAAMRFGRDGNGAVVYIHTNTLPEWVPLAGEGGVLRAWSDGRKEVVEAAVGRDDWTTSELAVDVSISERQVRTHLHDLVDEGAVSAEHRGNGFVWCDDGLHRVTDYGEVELDAVDLDSLGGDETAEVARSSIYTWDFRSSPQDDARDGQRYGTRDGAAGSAAANGGEPPPDPGG